MGLQGLARARELYERRDQRARELKAEGKTVVGYLCYFAPPEILEAAGCVPYRIRGDVRQPVTRADEYVEPYGCPFVRNTFDLAVKGRYDFLDGLVMSHACDSVQRMYGIWTHYKPLAFSHMVNVPHTITPASERFFRRELEFLMERVGALAGRPVEADALRDSIACYNRTRELTRELYALRKTAPPRISGTELLEVLIAGSGLPAAEFETLLREVRAEVTARAPGAGATRARLLFYGCINDDVTLVRLIEECAAHVVMDDTCIGARGMLGTVPDGDDPLGGFVQYYFRGFQCPRTYRGTDLSRFDYVVDAAREYGARGVVLYMLSFCDPHKFDLVDVRRHLEAAGLASLVLEDDYTLANLESMRTRIQAFVEMLA
ncbi:MAG: 2-hydroxyacyl-CoA dehydratase [Candidatus Rokubacteria bacterium]|nr:2-hydroxyacyl-CoA dehydratase [Candidatus Rokubacteria bacterium]